jgi:single-strand DNA-binding protein
MFKGATVTLAGYVANNPIFTTVNGTTPKVTMRVAWTARYQDRVTGEWRDGNTSFANVNCWRKLASNVAFSLRKGEAVIVTGRLQVREYEDREGRRRIAVDIEADAVGHDLARGVTQFKRTLGPAGESAAEGQPAGLAMGETIRSGQAGEQAPAWGVPGVPAAATVPGGPVTGDVPGAALAGPTGADGTATPGDVLEEEAVAELARAVDESAAAPVPF